MTGKEAAELNRIWAKIDRAAAVIAEADRLLADKPRRRYLSRPRRRQTWRGDPGVKGYT